ncbi:MAG: type VI secretion system tube protein TssD, partial [Rhodothermales bacterium]|nr:type VI secretion system tube protein TssD [Rhodothermales bacterium]
NGWFRGESTIQSQEREDTIEVVEFDHDLTSPLSGEAMDAGHDPPLGIRQHRPVRVIARIDSATPLMIRAWATNEVCEVFFRFFRPDPAGSGAEVEYYKVQLTGAMVVRAKTHFPNALRTETASLPEVIEYQFTYHDIIWTYLDGQIEYQDQWLDRPTS